MKIGRATKVLTATLVALGLVSTPLAWSFAQGLPGKPSKEKREDAKEKREDAKEKREDAKEKREDAKEKREDAKEKREDALKPEWKKKRDEWRDKRKERREEHRDAIKKKWGEDVVKRPAVREELRLHARRMARLNRILFLAEANDKTKLADQVKALIAKENARHDKRMEALKTEVKK